MENELSLVEIIRQQEDEIAHLRSEVRGRDIVIVDLRMKLAEIDYQRRLDSEKTVA